MKLKVLTQLVEATTRLHRRQPEVEARMATYLWFAQLWTLNGGQRYKLWTACLWLD